MNDDPRRTYRIDTDPSREIELSIHPQSAPHFSAELADSSSTGVAFVYAPGDAAQLAPGDAIELQFGFPDADDRVRIDATVCYVQEKDVYVRCGVELASGELRGKLDDRAWEVFNRRRCPRATLGTDSCVEVALELEDCTPLPGGWLYDISTHGFCVRLDSDAASRFESIDRLVAHFTLPGDWKEIEVSGVLRDVRESSGHVFVGIEYDLEAMIGFDELDVLIEDFVARAIVLG